MKVCSICNQTYSDENLNFCLNDGGVLTQPKDDAPPTLLMNQGRTTQPNWGSYDQPSPWQNQPLQTNQSATPNQNFYPPPPVQGQDQTLPTVSLVLGILGVVLFCCYGGFPFGLAAIITGYLGLQNFNKDAVRYGGRSLAIAGIVLGIIGLLGGLILLILGIAGNLFK